MTRRTVLLDLDGTLVDSYDGIAASVAHAVAAMQLPPVPPARLRTFVGPPLHDSFATLGLDVAGCDEAVRHYRAFHSDRGVLDNRLYPGVVAALDELRAAGFRLALATSKPEPFAVRVVAQHGLDGHLDHVAGATFDGRISTKGDVVAAALAALGHPDPATVVMVGDRSHDVAGAAEHGLRCVGVRWGYAEPGELEAAGACEYAATPADLAGVIGALLR